MYSLGPEDLPHSWPSSPSAQSLVSTSSLSLALPGAVSVHAWGVMEQERKPVGEEEEEQGSYFAFTAFFLAAARRG